LKKALILSLLSITICLLANILNYQYCSAQNSISPITIKCVGDSITSGLGMSDAHKTSYGGDTYPSILYTMLKDNGVNAIVENAGHEGEKTSSIISRSGNISLYVTEDLNFNDSGFTGPIDDKIAAVYSNDLIVPVTYTYTCTDVNPVIIDGQKYTAVGKDIGNNQWKVFLYKNSNNTTQTITAGKPVLISNSQNNDITIIFAGSNDKKDITIDDYVEMLKAGITSDSSKYIILGPYTGIYNRPNFVEGKTAKERKTLYLQRMQSEFGNHFIDLENEWFANAFAIANQNGYLNGLPTEKIDLINSKLNQNIIPAEFTYKNQEGNPHLNKAGYTVIARLVYERLKILGYI